jgi:hypothetical protein
LQGLAVRNRVAKQVHQKDQRHNREGSRNEQGVT